eukprot:gene5844-7273_t
MKQYPLILYPNYTISVFLFKNVLNTSEVMSSLLKGELEWSILNCKPIYDIQQILLAANRAAGIQLNGKLTTNNIHTELIFRLSPSTNIKESLKGFGLQPDDKEFYVILFNADDNKIRKVLEFIKGEEDNDFDLTKTSTYFDKLISRKLYNITEKEVLIDDKENENLKKSILNSMAIKGLL